MPTGGAATSALHRACCSWPRSLASALWGALVASPISSRAFVATAHAAAAVDLLRYAAWLAFLLAVLRPGLQRSGSATLARPIHLTIGTATVLVVLAGAVLMALRTACRATRPTSLSRAGPGGWRCCCR